MWKEIWHANYSLPCSARRCTWTNTFTPWKLVLRNYFEWGATMKDCPSIRSWVSGFILTTLVHIARFRQYNVQASSHAQQCSDVWFWSIITARFVFSSCCMPQKAVYFGQIVEVSRLWCPSQWFYKTVRLILIIRVLIGTNQLKCWVISSMKEHI